MPLTLFDIREGLASYLEQIDGLRVYKHQPATAVPNELPAVVIREFAGSYTTVYGGDPSDGQIRLTIVVKGGDQQETWARLDEYLTPEGDKSIPQLLKADQHIGLGNEVAVAPISFTGVRFLDESGGQLAADLILRFVKDG